MSPAGLETSRPIRARIDAAALRHNYQRVRHYAPTAKAWAVIKANAYGHGQATAVAALRELADGFALLECEQAVALRAQGVTQPILLLEGIFQPADAQAVVAHRLTSVVHHPWQLDALLAAAEGRPLAILLKLNTGMNRLGLTTAQLRGALDRLQSASAVDVGFMTHFAEADGPTGVGDQLAQFQRMLAGRSGTISLGNSAAILAHPGAHGDWVRPGIMLYGASPFDDQPAEAFDLRPVMTLESRIIATQTLQPGDRVGYGGTFVADRPMRLGVVACGYADGYPRHAPTGTPIAVLGQTTRTLGRVSMDMLCCDLTELPEADIGAPVTLWGQGAGGVVAADSVARAAGTIAYELFCALAPRVPVAVDGL